MENHQLASLLLVVGSTIFLVLGSGHVLAALVDIIRPTFFAPTKRELIEPLKQTSVQLCAALGHPAKFWGAYIGFNISHGLGVAFFGLVYLYIGMVQFELFQSYWPIPAVAIVLAATYFALSLKFWFYAPAIGSGISLACFTASYVLS